MRTRYIYILSLSLLAFVLLWQLVAKGNRGEDQSSTNERYFLISHAGAGDPFWNIVFKGAKEAEKKLGVRVQILAPEMPNDLARQVELLDSAIATKPKGIAISLPDDQAFSKSLRKAHGLGIPVIAFNTHPNLLASSRNPYMAFIGMDDRLAGSRLAKAALKSGGIRKQAVVAIHQAGHVGLERRFAGIDEVLSPENIAVAKLDISADASQALQIVEGYLKKNPDTSAIFFAGSFGLHALSRAINEKYPSIKQYSFDLTPLTISQISKKKVSLTVDQQPFTQGFLSIMQLYLKSNYELFPTDINTGVAIIDDNSAKAIKELVKIGVR